MANRAKHRTLLPEETLLFRPWEVRLLINSKQHGKYDTSLKKAFQRLISFFDRKGMKAYCSECGGRAKTLAFYKGVFFFELWCGQCSPPWLRHFGNRMTFVSGYVSALKYVDDFLDGDRKYSKIIINKLARLKGLKGKPDTREALAFFLPREFEMRCAELHHKPASQNNPPIIGLPKPCRKGPGLYTNPNPKAAYSPGALSFYKDPAAVIKIPNDKSKSKCHGKNYPGNSARASPVALPDKKN